jgi:hypothetical protein
MAWNIREIADYWPELNLLESEIFVACTGTHCAMICIYVACRIQERGREKARDAVLY